MADFYPDQVITIDAYSKCEDERKLTRLYSFGMNCLLNNSAIEFSINSSTSLIMSPGSFIMDDTLINFVGNTTIDLTNIDFYVSGHPLNEIGYYYVVVDYKYISKAKPANVASIRIIRPSEREYYPNTYFLFLTCVYVNSSYIIESLYDYDPENINNKRVYSNEHTSYVEDLPTFDTTDVGKIVYSKNFLTYYIGVDTMWREIDTLEYICDTTNCLLYDMIYIGENNIAHPAISIDPSTFSVGSVTNIGESTSGRIKLYGEVTCNQEDDIDIDVGDGIYLSQSQAGRVTNIEPDSNAQKIGNCIETSGSTCKVIITSLSGIGNSGITYIHNLLKDIQGGLNNNNYHLTLSDYNTLTEFSREFEGNHNNLFNIQGGSSTERYHLSETEHNKVSFVYDGVLKEFTLKSYIISLLNQEAEVRNIDFVNSSIQNSPIIGDIPKIDYSYTDSTGISYYGLYGLIEHSYILLRTSTMNTARYGSSSLSLTSDVGIVATGFNGASFTDSTERLTESTDVWSNRTDIINSRAYTSGMTYSDDIGYCAGGTNASVISRKMEEFSESSNTWTEKTDITNYRLVCGSSSLADGGLLFGGRNSGEADSEDSNYRYRVSGNYWQSKAVMSASRDSLTGISLTSDLSLAAGGMNYYSGSATYCDDVYRYSLSANSWVSRSVMPVNCNSAASLTFTTDCGMSAFGYSNELTISPVMIYKNSENSWHVSNNNGSDTTVEYPVGISFDSVSGTIAGGNISYATDQAWKYKNTKIVGIGKYSGSDYFGNNFNFFITNNIDQTALHHKSDLYINTGILSNQTSAIDSINVSVLSNNESEITYDVTFGDNNIENNLLNETIDTTSLNPNTDDLYQMRLKFNIGATNSDTWTSRTNLSYYTRMASSFSLNDDITIVAGGSNVSTARMTSVIGYSDVNNTSNTRTSLSYGIIYSCGLTLQENYGIMCGGINTSGYNYLYNTFLYSYTNNVWSSKSDMTLKRAEHSGIRLSSFYIAVAGGTNGSLMSSVERYCSSMDIWESRTSYIKSMIDGSGISLTSNIGLCAGGSNATGYISSTGSYLDVENSWDTKASLITERSSITSISLTYDNGVVVSGLNSLLSDLDGIELFSYSNDNWCVRSNIITPRIEAVGSSLTSSYGLSMLGRSIDSGNYTDSVEKYTYGETTFIGFAVSYKNSEEI